MSSYRHGSLTNVARKPIPDEVVASARELRASGVSLTAIALRLGIAYSSAHRLTKGIRRDLERPPEISARIASARREQFDELRSSVPRGPCGTPGCDDPICSVDYGRCHCGCGRQAPIARHTSRPQHHVKGEPVRYAVGHNRAGGTVMAVDGGAPLREACGRAGLTRRQVSIRAGLSANAVTNLESYVGVRYARAHCERIVATLNDAGAATTFDELFTPESATDDVAGMRRHRLRRSRPAIPPQHRYDGRHFQTPEHRQLAARVTRDRMQRVEGELARIKNERELLDAEDAAAQLFVHPAYILQLARTGRLEAVRLSLPGAPRERVLFQPDQVRALKRSWAIEHRDRPGNLLLDADEAVKRWEIMGWLDKLMARHALSRADAERLVRGRVADRRNAISRYAGGRPKRSGPPAHHLEWHAAFSAKRAELDHEFREREDLGLLEVGEGPASDWAVAEAVASDDFAANPKRWPAEYASRRYPGELAHEQRRPATSRVWEAVKPLLGAQRETPTT